MSGAHTAGPWSYERADWEPGDRCAVEFNGGRQQKYPWNGFAKCVVKMIDEPVDSPEGVANANLIAAAPDLLAAALAILPTADGYDIEGVDGRNLFRLRAAIAKATQSSATLGVQPIRDEPLPSLTKGAE